MVIFFLLLIMILSTLMICYLKYKTQQLKLLLISIIIPFLPFLFLYALPEILFHRYFLSADICSIFLMLIPFSFIFTQLTERIFDMEYFITRLRYYVSFSFAFTLWLLLGLYWFADLSISKMAEIFFFTFFFSNSSFFMLRKKSIIECGKFYFPQKEITFIDCIRLSIE